MSESIAAVCSRVLAMSALAEEKCDNFKRFLLQHTHLDEDKAMIAAMTWPLLREFININVMAEYESLVKYRDAPASTDEEARTWARSNAAILGPAASVMLGHLEFSSHDVIHKVVRYLVLFCEYAALEAR